MGLKEFRFDIFISEHFSFSSVGLGKGAGLGIPIGPATEYGREDPTVETPRIRHGETPEQSPLSIRILAWSS